MNIDITVRQEKLDSWEDLAFVETDLGII